jgi:ribose/xylose/arabinose/galactoside ABC-type transport system permease subunit
VLAPIGEDNLRDSTDVGIVVVSTAISTTLLVGLMVGTMHAWLITVIRLPPFVATLASLVGLRSLAKIMNQAVTAQLGNQVTKVRADDVTFEQLRQWWVAPVVFLVLSLLCWFLMNRTVVGRHLYAMGGNEEAARLSGIRTDWLKWLAYSIGSITAAIAGILYTAKVGAANPSTLAVGYELNAIAAAVVGGCSLQGGVGLIPGVMLGVLFLRIVIDSVAKTVRAGSDDYQGMIVGFLVVLAVAFNELRRHSGGTKKDFFPGLLGTLTIPVLAILMGTVVFVLTQREWGLVPGIVACAVVAIVLVLLKFYEVARAKRN